MIAEGTMIGFSKGYLNNFAVFVEEEAERLNNAPIERLFEPGTNAEKKCDSMFFLTTGLVPISYAGAKFNQIRFRL